MKIVLLCGYYYPDTVGGTEAYVQALGQNLQERGHEVIVAAPSTEEKKQQYTHAGLSVVRYPVTGDPSRDEIQRNVPPRYLNEWEDWLTSVLPDVVHMHSLTRGCSEFHARAVTRLDIPLFVTVHVPGVTCPRGTMMRWGTTPCDGEIRPVRCGACVMQDEGLPRPLAWAMSAASTTGIGQVLSGAPGTALQRAPLIHRRKERLQAWMGRAEHVVVVAGWLKTVLARNGIAEDHVTVSRHGLSESMRATQREAAQRRPSHDPEEPLRVGFVGRFTEVKGPHVLVEAVCKLPKSIDVEVRLYGMAQSDEDRQYWADMKQTAKDEPRVQFCGSMTEDNRVEAFAGFDVLAVPSIGFETGPLTVLEAFAAGLPVLGSDHSGIAERVEDEENGVLVPSGDISAWAAALRRIWGQHQTGKWTWALSEPRSSCDVASEMEHMYKRMS